MAADNFRSALATDTLTDPTVPADTDAVRGLFTSQDSAGTPAPPPPMPEVTAPVPLPMPVSQPVAATPTPPPPLPTATPIPTATPMAAATTMAAPDTSGKTTGGWDVDTYRLRSFGDAVTRARSYLDAVRMKVDRMQGSELTPQLGTSPVGEQLAKKFDDRLNSADGLREMLTEAMKRMEKFVASAEQAATAYEQADEAAAETFDNIELDVDLEDVPADPPPAEHEHGHHHGHGHEHGHGDEPPAADKPAEDKPAADELPAEEPPVAAEPVDILPAKG
jgi:hypothetical protein